MAITHAWHGLVGDMRDEVHDLTTITTQDAARQSYLALWATAWAMPLLFGLDKMFDFMHASWARYFDTWVNNILPGSTMDHVHTIGALEVVLAALVLFMPRVGGDLLALYLVLGAISVFGVGGMPVFGFALLAFAACALAMARLSTSDHRR